MKIRDNSIDSLKALTIFLVVLGHIIQNVKVDFDNNLLFKFIYSFHMPLFIFLSGYVAYNHDIFREDYIFRKAKSLLIPYFSWMVISVLYSFLNEGTSIFLGLKKCIFYPDNSLWFLWVLFFLHLILFISSKFFKSYFNYSHFLVSILLLLFAFFSKLDNIFSFKMLAFLAPFFFSGYLTNKYLFLRNFLEKKWALFFPLYFFLSIFWERNNSLVIGDFLVSSKILIYLYKNLTAFSGILFFFGFIRSFKSYSTRFLDIGRNSMAIYALNFYLITAILMLDPGGYISRYFILFSLPTALLVIFISLIICRLVKLNNVLSFFLLGIEKS